MTRRIMRACCVTLLGALMLHGSISPAAAAQDAPKVTERMRTGAMESSYLPEPGTSVKWGRATALVNASAADIEAVVHDYAEYKSFLPNFQASKVLSKRGASALVYVQVSVMHGASKIWAELKARPKKAEGPTKVVDIKMLKGNVKHFGARWEITPVNDKQSIVTFQLLVDPDLPVPSSMVSAENAKSARKTIRALRKLMVSLGLAAPIASTK
jgi:ribosome-associated toxin RatA of RatAB toxin-antitoxin module